MRRVLMSLMNSSLAAHWLRDALCAAMTVRRLQPVQSPSQTINKKCWIPVLQLEGRCARRWSVHISAALVGWAVLNVESRDARNGGVDGVSVLCLLLGL
jgi:hypothetical protein